MTFTISTDNTASAADGAYTFPSAREFDEDERPKLLYQQPTGRKYLQWRRLDAQYRTELEAFLDERRESGEMPPDEFLEAAADEAGITLIDEEADLEDLDDDEQVVSREQYRQRVAAMDFSPPEGLYGKLLDFCVDRVVGAENVHIQTADGKYPLNWSDGDDLVEKFEDVDDPDEARRQIVDSFGEYPWERAQAPIELAREICSGMSPDQKKD